MINNICNNIKIINKIRMLKTKELKTTFKNSYWNRKYQGNKLKRKSELN